MAKTKTILQTINYDEKAESYVPDEGIRSNLRKKKKKLIEVDKGKLQEKEFRIMIMKMKQDLRGKMEAKIEKMKGLFAKDLQELKNKDTEMNNTLERINSRITEEEEWIYDLGDRMVEITATEQNIEKE